MCKVNRREFLATGTAFLSLAAEAELLLGGAPKAAAQAAAEVDQLAPDIYFHAGDLVSENAPAVCNNGWIIFEDYVLVIDANFPAGAKLMISKIRAMTDKPIRFAFDTHHHGDHAYGNQVFVEAGGVPIAHTGVLEEMRRHESGYYGGKPGNWESAAKERDDVRQSRLKPPSVLFPKELYFDDGKHRVELMHLGVAHTHGDAVAWLRHGPRSTITVLDDQQAFFKVLQEQVHSRMSDAGPAEVKTQIEAIRSAMKAMAPVARYVSDQGSKGDGFPSQVQKVYEELNGKKLSAMAEEPHLARHAHAHSHGVA